MTIRIRDQRLRATRASRAVWTLLFLVAFSFTGLLEAAAPFQAEEATIADIHAAMRTGQISCRSLVTMYLERIAAYDKKGPAINAVITVNPKALTLADELDARFARSGFSGPLHCIPIVVKDNYNTFDMPTTAGSLSLKGVVPPEDAWAVKKLREAGAIILGKTNLDEFARGAQGLSSLGGQTLNPYALDRIPGGSSAGTGAAVAASLAAAGLGTETGVSIRNPSTNNSLVGIAPTRGLVSRYGIVPISFTQDRGGPMARTVADAAAVLDAIAGYDPQDFDTAWSVGRLPQSYTAFLKGDGLNGARIGVVRELFGPEGSETTKIVNAAIQEMRRQGAIVVDPVPVDPVLAEMLPILDPAYLRNRHTMPVELVKVLSDARVNDYEFKFALNDYLAQLGPEAPIKSLDDLIESDKFLPRLKNGLLGSNEYASLDIEEYIERLLRQRAISATVAKVMADHNLDALVYPMKIDPAPKIGESAASGHVLSSIPGLPAIVVPVGFTGDGLPVSVEFLGKPFTEPTLIKLAYSYEQATHHRRPPASTPPLSK